MLRAERLTVARGRRVLLEDFSLELEPGEALHVVGPNGCGKSSLLRVLAGVAEPRRGRVRRAARSVFIPERLALPDSLPARRWLRVTGASGGRLAPELDRRCGALSKGQLQRVALAGAIGDVDQRCLLVLDEPWAGLDATARAKLDADLGGAAARGATVIYTDHSGAGALSATRSLALGLADRSRGAAAVRYASAQLSLAISGRRLLAPATLTLFTVIGVYAYRPNPVQGSFAVTAVLSPLFCAWLVAAIEREVGPSAGAILTVAAGGADRAWRGRLALIAIVSAAVTVVFLVWPTATGAFDRNPGAADLIAAALAHLVCGAFGGTLALVVAAPVRTATAFGAVLVTIICSIALAHPLGAIAGPGAVARALDTTPVDAVSDRLAAACAGTLAEAAAIAYGARRLARWRG